MKPAVYPDSFFIAHRLFTGHAFPAGGTWGDILDGPMGDENDVVEAIVEACKSEETGPTEENLRVWFIESGKPAEECTGWALEEMDEQLTEYFKEYYW